MESTTGSKSYVQDHNFQGSYAEIKTQYYAEIITFEDSKQKSDSLNVKT